MLDDYEKYLAEEDQKSQVPNEFRTFRLALRHAQRTGKFQHHINVDTCNCDLSECFNWCISNFGPDAIPQYVGGRPRIFRIINENSWTFGHSDYYFDNEDDALAFKMKFS